MKIFNWEQLQVSLVTEIKKIVYLITLPKTAKVSCQFTNNKLKAAPVKLAIEHLSHSSIGQKDFLINAGNANAATGSQGMRDVKFYCEEMASVLNLKKENIIPFSTGVIGEALPVNNYLSAFREASNLDYQEITGQKQQTLY